MADPNEIPEFTTGHPKIREPLNVMVRKLNAIASDKRLTQGSPMVFCGMERGVPAKFVIRAIRTGIGTEAEPEDAAI